MTSYLKNASNEQDVVVGESVVTPVTSKYLSKTNITGALLAVFGLLTAFGVLPAEVSTPAVVGSVVAAGGVLVTIFRTIARSIVK